MGSNAPKVVVVNVGFSNVDEGEPGVRARIVSRVCEAVSVDDCRPVREVKRVITHFVTRVNEGDKPVDLVRRVMDDLTDAIYPLMADSVMGFPRLSVFVHNNELRNAVRLACLDFTEKEE